MNHHSTSRSNHQSANRASCDADAQSRAVLYARFMDIQRQADLACDAIDRGAPDRTLNNAIEKLEIAVRDFAVARMTHSPHDDETSAEPSSLWPELAGNSHSPTSAKAARGECLRDLLRRWKNRNRGAHKSSTLKNFSTLRG